MASEYLKWKYRDVKPAEKPAPLTPREKRANWWYYNKWPVVIGLVLVLAAGDILWHALGIGETEPDFQFAYVGEGPLPDDTAAALETALAALGTDANGDGRTLVRLNQYVTGGQANADYGYASSTRLAADIEGSDSYFFLLEDPEGFQRGYQLLRRLDGTLPEETDGDWAGCCLAWADCPVLTGLDLGTYSHIVLGEEVTGQSQELLRGLYIARRGFWTEKVSANAEACDELWNTLTEGATQ